VDSCDETISTHVSAITKLDYLDQSSEVIKVTQLSLQNIKQSFKRLAKDAQMYLAPSQLKETVVKRKLGEYLRLLIMQVLSQINDLSVDANDLLVKLIVEFKELHRYFDKFTESDFERLGVHEVRKLRELEMLLEVGLAQIGDFVADREIRYFTADEIEQLVVARFQKTTLRQSIIKGIHQ